MSSNNGLTRSYVAEAAVGSSLIVKMSATTDYNVLPGAAATDKFVGISTADVSAAIGERVDVVHENIADLKIGAGGVARGDPITSDATGQGITAAPAAGVNAYVIGFALIAGAAGDIIPVMISRSVMQG